MAQLKQAGFLASLGSFFFPKKVVVQVRTETLPNGQVQVTPCFSVEGQEIPNGLITPDPNQRILGYSVVLDKHSLQVHRHTQGRPTRLSKKEAAGFLTRLCDSGVSIRSKDGKAQPRFETVKPDISLELRSDDSLLVKSELITSSGIVLSSKPTNLSQLQADEGWYSLGDDLLQIDTSDTPLDQMLIAEGGNGVLAGGQVPHFIKMIDQESKHIGEIEKNDPLKPLSVFSGEPQNRAIVDGDAESISISPSLTYSGTEGRMYEQSKDDLQRFDNEVGGFLRVLEGWLEVTPGAIDRFRQGCGELSNQVGSLDRIEGKDIPDALLALQRISKGDGVRITPWTIYFSEAVKSAHRLIDIDANVRFRLNVIESDGRSLLELDPIYNHERFQLNHSEIEEALEHGDNWVRRRDAWIKVDQDKYKKITAGARLLNLEPGPNGFIFPAQQREQVIDLFSVLGSIEHSAAYADFLLKLADFQKIEDVPLPSTLKAKVQFRAYQKHGFNWLAFLHRFGLNGILADDMGLGKTLQTLAVIHRAKEMSTSHFPSLIICPTSVVSNWKSEIGKFFVRSNAVVYRGRNREKDLNRVKQGIASRRSPPLVITSFDIARRDHELLNKIPWLYVVIDEGHNIKNPDAQRTKAIKTINGQHKLALTGTPIQNNLEELWSLFDFAMPGYLGKRATFRDEYGCEGRVDWDAVYNGVAPLKERIYPFILRRLKENVAKDLPPKTITDMEVFLTPKQRQLYKQVSDSPELKRLFESVEKNGVAKSSPLILAAFTKLRSICNHPALAEGNRNSIEIKYTDSAKLICLKELIEEVVEGDHRTLLFSQSTKMLDIIEDFFKRWKVRTVRLDGEVPPHKRSQLVEEFNHNPKIHCFLISTKAGGTGLNLTGADTVIFYDHDWNPANDSQAQDRAHRIGQEKPVNVYRLVCKGTIEEKILKRQFEKKSIADQIIGSDDDGFKHLTKDQLLSLFRFEDQEGDSDEEESDDESP